MNFLNNKTILITGGTGSFGNAAVEFLTSKCRLKKIIIFSRDENKQFEMMKKFKNKIQHIKLPNYQVRLVLYNIYCY